MQVTETLSNGLKRGYTVVVPAADIESRRSQRLAELGKTLRLPGFRPGKIPASIVRQRFSGAVTAEVLEQSVNDATRQVLSDRGLRTAGQPKVEVVSIEEAKDLEFKVELEILPDISVPDLSMITLTRLRAEPQTETIDRALDQLATRQRELLDVTEDRAAQTGDVLTADFVGSTEGVPFPGGAGTDVDIDIGGGNFIPGFAEQLVGMRRGDSRTIDVTFPENYGSKELAGKTAQFAVTAKKLRQSALPPIDDALATKLGFDGLAEVRDVITQQVKREYDQLSRMKIKRELLDALAGLARFDVPEGMVDGEFTQIWQRVEADRKAGQLDADDAGKDEATLQAEYRAIAERRVRLGLLLAEIGRANNISVGTDEMARAMRAEAMRYPGQEAAVIEFFRKNPEAAERLRGPVFEEKVIDFVLELAQVTDQTVTPEELTREPEAQAHLVAQARAALASEAQGNDITGSETAAYQQQPDNSGYQQQPDNSGYQQQPDNSGYQQQPDNSGYQQQPDNSGYQQQPDNSGYQQQPDNSGYQQQPDNSGYQQQPDNSGYQQQPDNSGYQQQPVHVEQADPGFRNEPPLPGTQWGTGQTSGS